MKKEIICDGLTCIVSLTKGEHALIDSSDLEIVEDYSWSCTSYGYAQTRYNGVATHMHRIITKCPRGFSVDHINGNKLDNRRCNLRICKNRSNVRNSVPRHGLSKYKGVTTTERPGIYRAYITVNRKQISLGRYDNEIEAAIAYNKAAEQYFGKYALLNHL